MNSLLLCIVEYSDKNGEKFESIVQWGQSKLFPDFKHAKLEQNNMENICKIKQAYSFLEF